MYDSGRGGYCFAVGQRYAVVGAHSHVVSCSLHEPRHLKSIYKVRVRVSSKLQ